MSTTPASPQPARRPLRGLATVAVVAVLYLVWTIVTTWPLARHFGSGVPNDLGDPLLVAWFVWWDSHVLPLTARWWNAPMFYPMPGTLAFSEHFLGTTLIAGPVLRVTGNLLLAYNVAFVLTFVLSALSAYGLCFAIVRRHDAAFVAGLAFGFAPYRWGQLSHLHVLSSYWIPLTLLALHAYFEDLPVEAGRRGTSDTPADAGRHGTSDIPVASAFRRKIPARRRIRWLALFAIAWVLQALSCGYYLFYGSVLVGLWLLWFAAGRERWQDLARVAGAWIIGSVVISPIVFGYWFWQGAYGFHRWIGEIEVYSADVASLLRAPDLLRFWGWVNVFDRPESALFPGLMVPLVVATALVVSRRQHGTYPGRRFRTARWLTVVALVFVAAAAVPLAVGPWRLEIGGVRLLSLTNAFKPFSIAVLLLAVVAALNPMVRSAWGRRSPLAFYVVAAGAMWLLSLGPAPTFMGRILLYKAPYAWLMVLPGFDGVRVPARFWMLATLCLACAAGLGLARLGVRWPRLRSAMFVAMCLGLAVDGWPNRLNVLAAPEPRPNHTDGVARLDLPMGQWSDITAVYRSAHHQRPIINGYSGYFAPHYWALGYLLAQGDPNVLTRLSSLGPIEIVVDHAQDPERRWRHFVEAHPQVETIHSESSYTAYRLRAGEHVRAPAEPDGEPLTPVRVTATVNSRIVGMMTDNNVGTPWMSGAPQRPEVVTIDLGTSRRLAAVVTELGSFTTDFPRLLVVETSDDTDTWRTAWSGPTALMAMSAAMEHPRTIPLVFALDGVSARYVRLRQLGTDPSYYWTIAELRIIGRRN